jgi:DNA-directed RNA polymerase II subunit RPB11
MNNIPNYLDSVLLSDQISKIEFVKNKENLNYGIFKIQKEDHTIGDLIQKQLLKEPNVLYSGYKQIHPLEHFIVFKIITNGILSPVEIFDKVLKDLYIEFSLLEENLCRILLVK